MSNRLIIIPPSNASQMLTIMEFAVGVADDIKHLIRYKCHWIIDVQVLPVYLGKPGGQLLYDEIFFLIMAQGDMIMKCSVFLDQIVGSNSRPAGSRNMTILSTSYATVGDSAPLGGGLVNSLVARRT
jgi:hypothetical protein